MLHTPTPDSAATPIATRISRLFFIDAAVQILFLPDQVSLAVSLVSGLLARWNHPFAMPSIVILGAVRMVWLVFLMWLSVAFFGPMEWPIFIITFIQRMMVYVGVLVLVYISSTTFVARLIAIGVVATYPLGYLVLWLI